MSFYKSPLSFDLTEVPIERMFITEFLPLASGTHVKVYLLGFTYAQTNEGVDNRHLAQALQIPLADVIESWQYWEKIGIIRRHFHEESDAFDVEFLSLRELYITSNFKSKSQQQSKRQSQFYQNIDMQNKLREKVEATIGYPLRIEDYRQLSDFYDHYYSDIDIIARAFEVNYKERNIRNIKAVKSLLNLWLDKQLTTLDAVNTYLVNQANAFQNQKRILKCLGYGFRNPTDAEKELINHWMDDFGFTIDDLEAIIKSLSKKTLNLNFKYLETTFKNLYDKGVTTLDGFLQQDTSSSSNNVANKEPAKPAARNRFTMQKETTYSEEELEDMLLKKKS